MAHHNKLGRWGESVAVEYLITIGYTIVETNWRMGHYETDIIATKGNRIIFTEVKTRSTDDFDPLEAINTQKKNRMVRSANAYILAHDLHHEVQYDIITIIGDQHQYTLEHIPDAFIPSVVTRRGSRR